ncbi:hypothetical protein C8046_17435 [Serinibacter arcticus]|uniref:Lipoprotein n=1 Tax=Serinibacter arcticus TaxID=1655435 RepID=A0A2U1ZYU5_9MICO|nr:hypothetical protein [Serinibacter arcticus]PWD52159.1 hypothetical protein C8046_17435 [Serinibacter arcticus]
MRRLAAGRALSSVGLASVALTVVALTGCSGSDPDDDVDGVDVTVSDVSTDDGLRYTVEVTNGLDEPLWFHDYYGSAERANGGTLRIVQEFGTDEGEWTDGGPGGDPVVTLEPGRSDAATWMTTGDPLADLGLGESAELVVCVELVTRSQVTDLGLDFGDVETIERGVLEDAPRRACSEPVPVD